MHVHGARGVKLIFKDLSPASLLAEAKNARPLFVYEPLREIEMYRSVLAPRRLGTAKYFASVADEPEVRFWLFLERVPGVELYQVEDTSAWEAVAGHLGSLHEALAGEIGSGFLPSYDAIWYRRWMKRSRQFHDSGPAAQALADLEEAHDSAVLKLCELPPTVIHGDFNASNIILSPQAGAMRVCPIDWERAAVGPGLLDLAALTMGWDDRRSAMLARAYAKNNRIARGLNSAELFHYLDCARLHLCIQWLGWSSGWAPPKEHRRDWLSEARAAAARLGKAVS